MTVITTKLSPPRASHRDGAIDLLRGASLIAVVTLHSLMVGAEIAASCARASRSSASHSSCRSRGSRR